MKATQFVFDELGVDLVILGLRRHELPCVPLRVLREVLANAVAHRSYELRGAAVRVEMRPDRIEIASPGCDGAGPERGARSSRSTRPRGENRAGGERKATWYFAPDRERRSRSRSARRTPSSAAATVPRPLVGLKCAPDRVLSSDPVQLDHSHDRISPAIRPHCICLGRCEISQE